MGTLSSRKLLPDSQDSGEPIEDRNAIKAEVGPVMGSVICHPVQERGSMEEREDSYERCPYTRRSRLRLVTKGAWTMTCWLADRGGPFSVHLVEIDSSSYASILTMLPPLHSSLSCTPFLLLI